MDRSLVQVASRRSDGGVKTCFIHDLLRDLCMAESKSDKFLEVCMESNIDALSNTNPRRLSFHCQPHSYISANTIDRPCTRSVFFFSRDSVFFFSFFFSSDSKGGPPVTLDYVLKSFKLARVLHFEWGVFVKIQQSEADDPFKILEN